MGNKLSAHQQQQIKAAFLHFDLNNNGQITLDEFQVN
jgi:Ca2+-binding EF-hand superfamily protein